MMLSDCFCSLSLSLSHALSISHPPSVPAAYLYSCGAVFFCFVVVVKSLSGRPPGDSVCAHASRTHTAHAAERSPRRERGKKIHSLDGCPEQLVADKDETGGGRTLKNDIEDWAAVRGGGGAGDRRRETPLRTGPQRRTSHVV